MTKTSKTSPSAQRLAPKAWVATIKNIDGGHKVISSLVWVARHQAVSEARGWHMMLQRSGRA